MESKHTKAPWQATHYGDDEIVVISADQKTHICRINQSMAASDFTHVREEAEANAKLCASAPELLEALKLLVNICKFVPKEVFTEMGKNDFQTLLDNAATAINKATN